MSQPSDSSAPAESLLTSQNDDLFPGGWSADGRSLVFESERAGDSELRVLPIDGRPAATLSDVPSGSNRPAISPDGRWLAYGIRASKASGRPTIYVRPFPGPGPSRQFVDAAGQPVWSRDGEKIFFRSRRGGSSASSATGFSKCLSIVRVGSRPARNGSCSASSLLKMRGLVWPVTTSRPTVDS
jgi:Tol biopolymer transport system component